ncbi:MAG: hypothetical protein ABIN69_15350 [Aestuariivirga sp.]
MVHMRLIFVGCATVALLALGPPVLAQQAADPAKPAAQADPAKPAATPTAPADPAKATDTTTPADPSAADTDGAAGPDDLSIGEIPDVQTEELTPELAKKAIDGYAMVHVKYQDSPLEDYQDLQEFVDKDPKGKEFETDIKTFGFASVNDWNLAVTTLSFAYTNILDDQTGDLKQQIDEITADTTIAQDMKDRMIKSLKAMIPSDNNKKIVEDLIKDPTYGEKIKLLESTEE